MIYYQTTCRSVEVFPQALLSFWPWPKIIQLSKLCRGLHNFISASSLLEDHLAKHPLKFCWALGFTTWLLAAKHFAKVSAKLHFHTCWPYPHMLRLSKLLPKLLLNFLRFELLLWFFMFWFPYWCLDSLWFYLDSLDSPFRWGQLPWVVNILSNYVNPHEAFLKLAIAIFNSSSPKTLAF